MGVASLAMVPIAMWGVSPLGWSNKPDITQIDEALNDYPIFWAAAGHPDGAFPTSYSELIGATGATAMKVGD